MAYCKAVLDTLKKWYATAVQEDSPSGNYIDPEELETLRRSIPNSHSHSPMDTPEHCFYRASDTFSDILTGSNVYYSEDGEELALKHRVLVSGYFDRYGRWENPLNFNWKDQRTPTGGSGFTTKERQPVAAYMTAKELAERHASVGFFKDYEEYLVKMRTWAPLANKSKKDLETDTYAIYQKNLEYLKKKAQETARKGEDSKLIEDAIIELGKKMGIPDTLIGMDVDSLDLQDLKTRTLADKKRHELEGRYRNYRNLIATCPNERTLNDYVHQFRETGDELGYSDSFIHQDLEGARGRRILACREAANRLREDLIARRKPCYVYNFNELRRLSSWGGMDSKEVEDTIQYLQNRAPTKK